MGHLGHHRPAQVVQDVAVVHVLLVKEVGVALPGSLLLALLRRGGGGHGGGREGGDLDDEGGAGGGSDPANVVDGAARPAAQLAADPPGLGRRADEDAGGTGGAFGAGPRHGAVCFFLCA